MLDAARGAVAACAVMSSFPSDELPTVAARPQRSLWAAALLGHGEGLSLLAGRGAPAVYAWLRAHGVETAEAVARTEHFFARLLTTEPPLPNDEDVDRLQDFLLRRLAASGIAAQPEAAPPATKPRFDPAQAERRFLREAAKSPDDIFHRRWALGALELTMETLREEYQNEGQAALYAQLPQFLSFSGSEEKYEELGRALAISGSGLHAAVYQFRQRYRETLRRLVGDTVRQPEDVDAELTKLLVSAS